MGILDGITNKVKYDLEWKAGQTISDGLAKGAGSVLNKGQAPSGTAACPKCKAPVPDPRPKFCAKCGTPLIVTCKKCNAEYPTGTNFCTGCGKKL